MRLMTADDSSTIFLAHEGENCLGESISHALSSNDDSTSSINLSDYSKKTWLNVVGYGVPTVGFAVFAMTHPFMFLTGAAISLLSYGGAYAADVDTSRYSMLCGSSKYRPDSPKSEGDLPHELTITTTESVISEDERSKESSQENFRENDEQKHLPLENVLVNEAVFSSLNAEDFFRIFWGNDAPFSYKDFQEKRGDIDVVYSPWIGNKKRVVNFRTPTHNPFFGLSHAPATKNQELKAFFKNYVIIDCTTQLRDIPYSDRFVVVERWIFFSDSDRNLFVTISAQVNFSQSCPFESQIKSKTISTLRQTLIEWCTLAEKALLYTQKSICTQEETSANEIEVGLRDKNNESFVLGEDWEMDPLEASPKSERLHPVRGLMRSFLRRKHAVK